MTPEAQRIAIAKVCGYTDEGPNCPPGKFRENIFNADASQRYDYAQLLEGICAQDRSESEYGRPIWKATAAQRAEALLKTLNLWKP